jgi:hypothetical protein
VERASTGEAGLGGPNSEEKFFSNKNCIFEFTKALEICRRRFRKNFDMTMSTTVITVLHSAEAIHITHESSLSSDNRILVVPTSTLTHIQGVCQEITTRQFNGFI